VILRSMLYAPATHPRHAAGALAGQADAAILDLEDAVADDRKEEARRAVGGLLDGRPPAGPAAFVRVNGLRTPHAYRDLLAVVMPGVEGVVVPKVESAAEVAIADWMLSQLEGERGIPGGGVELVPVVETASGLRRLDEIAAASPRVRRLGFGAADLSADTGIALAGGSEGMVAVKVQLVVTSRAAGLEPPMDSVYPDFRDAEGFEREAEQARRLGLFGKTCIHPSQVELANRVFTPTEEEQRLARDVLRAFEEALARGSASVQLEGRMIDYPIAERARRVVELADRLAGRPAR
jgi:citrate lyase subunit beta / citryl-CoA lyase